MGDVKKDVEDMLRMRASDADSLKIMADLSGMIVRTFYKRIIADNRGMSKQHLLKKLDEEIFYGRRDNIKHRRVHS